MRGLAHWRAASPACLPAGSAILHPPEAFIHVALAFAIHGATDRYVTPELEDVARMIASGRSRSGSNLEYLDRLAKRLALLGVNDPRPRGAEPTRAGVPHS